MPAPKNQGGGINLSKQNLMSQGSLTTDQMLSFGQRKSRPDVDYVRNRIASGLESRCAISWAFCTASEFATSVTCVGMLLSEIKVGPSGEMLSWS